MWTRTAHLAALVALTWVASQNQALASDFEQRIADEQPLLNTPTSSERDGKLPENRVADGAEKSDPWREKTAREFLLSYGKAGKPRLAIFWNQKFDGQLSQWQALIRNSKTGEGAGSAKEKFEPSGGKDGYKRDSTGGGRIISAEYWETPIEEKIRVGLPEGAEHEFEAGFVQPFLNRSVQMIDRATVMRLAQRDNTQKAGTEVVSDFKKLEVDALVDYADYLIEILLDKEPDADRGVRFFVSVKDTHTGRILAMFKSDGHVAKEKQKDKQVWVATNRGFEKKIIAGLENLPTMGSVGAQLAYQTMEALIGGW